MGPSRHIRDVRAMSASLATPDILLSRSKRRSGPLASLRTAKSVGKAIAMWGWEPAAFLGELAYFFCQK
jgi:hypothetical protein